MSHSEGLRIRVIKAVVEDGLSRNEAAEVFRVGIASAVRWVKAYEAEGRTAALATGGDRRSVLKAHRDWLLALLRTKNDLTLEAVAERLWAAHAVRADKSMLSRFFKGEGFSLKKKPYAPASRNGRTWPRRAPPGAARSLISRGV